MSEAVTYKITINNLIKDAAWPTRVVVKMLDKALGISRMNKLYHLHQMQGLSKEDFADKLIDILQLDIRGIKALQEKIPTTGPVVIASNHPFGGIEGVILARVIGQVRPDLKVLANKGLGIFKELRDYFIFTNPLSEKDPTNGPSLRKCIKHVGAGGALLLFPAGRVSYYQAEKKGISEHTWNKIVGRLTSINNCQYVPVFVNGSNSKWFYRLGRVYYRIRMLLLARELLNKTGAVIDLNAGYPVEQKYFKHNNHVQSADLCRGMSYLQDNRWSYTWPADKVTHMKPLLPPVDSKLLKAEIETLPTEQRLIENKNYQVYYAYQHQIPNTVTEIARLRELVFREFNEGSGEPLDTDHFDATYTQLFIFNKKTSQIMGAYRMGLTDKLIEKDGMDGLYLHKMFDFAPEFMNQKSPCIELGRSFLVPEFQGSFQGLLLLWKGICAFVFKYPQYRMLYGTVSISKLYQPKSVKLIESLLIKPENKDNVSPRNSFNFDLHTEIASLSEQQVLFENIGPMLMSLEQDGKGIPTLAKQYIKMGANFHALAIDKSFNDTPGLLLSVDMVKSPERLLKLYMGDNYREFLDYWHNK